MNWKQPKVYAVRHKDEAIRAASRSGGIFTALSDFVLSNGGVVYGCVLTENFMAVHARAESEEERNRMRGSKYIQSKLGDTFQNVRADLEAGRSVLFSGTSCQVAGLKLFLGKKHGKLLCIDIVCKGVPSGKVWDTYLQWLEQKKRSKITCVDFRNKRDFGWRDHVETICFEDDRIADSKVFTNMFHSHCILRPSCYECPYKSVIHPGDITIADYWGIEKAASEFDDNKGVSLVLVNNEKGQEALEQVKNQLVGKETKLEDSLQSPLKTPVQKPRNRERFWQDFYCKPFGYIARIYGKYGWKSKLKTIMKRIKKKVFHSGKRTPNSI